MGRHQGNCRWIKHFGGSAELQENKQQEGEGDCEHSHCGFVLLQDCLQWSTVCLDGKAKPFCHAKLRVQKPRGTGGHCYLFGLSFFLGYSVADCPKQLVFLVTEVHSVALKT